MNKELQDHVWKHCLPKEFKEEVKKYYRTLHEQYKDYDGLNFVNAKAKVKERVVTLQYFFGEHNLTSDAEGEEDEMLYVSRKQVQEIYSQNQKEIHRECVSSSDKDCYETVNEVLKTLFGSKCLPDEKQSAKSAHCSEPKPSEPKFKVGDKVRYKEFVGTVYQIEETDYVIRNLAGGDLIGWLKESDLAPYTEPKPAEPKFKIGDELVWDKRIMVKVDEVFADGEYLVYSRIGNRYMVKESDLAPYTEPKEDHIVQDHEIVDRIIKDGFLGELRLNIAAQMMQGLICAPLIPGCNPNPPAEQLAQTAFRLADAFIAEAEKGGKA